MLVKRVGKKSVKYWECLEVNVKLKGSREFDVAVEDRHMAMGQAYVPSAHGVYVAMVEVTLAETSDGENETLKFPVQEDEQLYVAGELVLGVEPGSPDALTAAIYEAQRAVSEYGGNSNSNISLKICPDGDLLFGFEFWERDQYFDGDINDVAGELKRLAGIAWENRPANQLNTPIDVFALPVRVVNSLMADGFTHLEQLTALEEWELLKLPNLGKKSLADIKEAMASRGLFLKPSRRHG